MAIPRPANPSAARASRASSPRRSASARAAVNAARAASSSPARTNASPRASSTGPASSSVPASSSASSARSKRSARVLVGEPVERATAGAEEHLARVARVRGRRRLEEMHGDLLEVAVLSQLGQGRGRALVKPGAAQGVAFVVDRLAHERVGELEAVRPGGGAQEPAPEEFVERRLDGRGPKPGGCLQGPGVVLEAEDRGCGDELVRVLAHARQPDADSVADAFRHLLRPRLRQLRASTSSTKNAFPLVRACTRARDLVAPNSERASAATSSGVSPRRSTRSSAPLALSSASAQVNGVWRPSSVSRYVPSTRIGPLRLERSRKLV